MCQNISVFIQNGAAQTRYGKVTLPQAQGFFHNIGMMKDLFITELAQYTAKNKNAAEKDSGYSRFDLSSNHTGSPQSMV